MPPMPVFVFAVWSLFCAFIGLIAAPWVLDDGPVESHVAQNHGSHEHALLEVDPTTAPRLSVDVVKDAVSGWNLRLEVEKFRFAPETVNAENQPGEGHAHLYVNGEKMARLYGTAFHMPDLPPGEHEITVSLNSNDHSILAIDGKPIEARITITQPETAPKSF